MEYSKWIVKVCGGVDKVVRDRIVLVFGSKQNRKKDTLHAQTHPLNNLHHN